METTSRFALLLLLLLLLVVVVTRSGSAGKSYTTKYDQVDVEAIVRNERLLNNYVGCLLDKNPCTPDGAELKKNLPDALATNCQSCSESQRQISEKLSHFLIDNRPKDWSLLEKKFDPTGAYRERYLNSPSTPSGAAE